LADNARRTWPLGGYFDDPEAEPDDEAPDELPLAPLPRKDAEALQSAPFASLIAVPARYARRCALNA